MKCIWLTGLPCSGKTTIAKELEKKISNSIVLDGDELRATALGKNVGFSEKDRYNHILRMGAIAKLFTDDGTYAICSFVSPDAKARDAVRATFAPSDFIEVFVSTRLEECISRDVKGMYARAIKGEIPNFTGIGSDYDVPVDPEMVLFTENSTPKQLAFYITEHIEYYKPKAALFIGRWNGVFHNGHDYIVKSKLDAGGDVILAIRDVKPDTNNPWTAVEVKEMLDYRFIDNKKVSIIIIPDIKSVEYGRGVGYDVNEIKVDKVIAGISGTELRLKIAAGDNSWKEFVPAEIAEFMENK